MSLKRSHIIVTVIFIICSISLLSEVKVTLIHYSQWDVKENPQIKIKSPGIPTVPVGQVVYLKADASDGDITGYQWRLESPAESQAVLSASTVSHPTLVPDLEGQYKVKVSVTFGAGKTEEASLWLNAGTFVGDGFVVKSGSAAQCINCHEEEVKNGRPPPTACFRVASRENNQE